jgi:hypothetical protein
MNSNIPSDPPADLFITDALDSRPPAKADYRREGRAIQELAFRMADHPEAVLPQFVEVAMLITGASGAGVSLYEATPTPGVFRWGYLRGALAGFEGLTTPCNVSPCGVALDAKRPVLTRRPGRVYTWIEDAGVEAPEVLIIPLFLDGPEPLGTLWVVAEEEGLFTRDHARVLTELADDVGKALAYWRKDQVLAAG